MGNKSLSKNTRSNEEFINTQLRHHIVSSNEDLTYSPLYDNKKSDFITFNIIDNNKLYSVLDLALNIQLVHLNRVQYQTNQSLYTSALFYQCKEKNSLILIRNSIVKGTKVNVNRYKTNTFKSQLINKRNSLNRISPISRYQSNKLIDESLIPIDSKGLMSNKEVSSSQLSSNYNSDGFSNRDEKTIISLNKEHRVDSNNTNVPIEEESFKCDKHKSSRANTQWGKRASIKSCITFDVNYRNRNVMVYSKQIRDKCLRVASNNKKDNGLSTHNEFNEIFANNKRNTKHNESLMNFLYENLNGNPMDNGKGEEEAIIKAKYKTQRRIANEVGNSFKVNIKEISKEITASFKWNRKTINYQPIKKNNKAIFHKHFISTYEHLIGIDPHNRTHAIKSISKQKKLQKNKAKDHLQQKEVTDLNDSILSSSMLGLNNEDSECSISFNTNLNKINNAFILNEAINTDPNQFHHFKGISSIPKTKPNRNHFQLHFISKSRIQ